MARGGGREARGGTPETLRVPPSVLLGSCALGRSLDGAAPVMISTRRHLWAPESRSKPDNSGTIVNKIWGWHAVMRVATPCLHANARESPRIHRFAQKYARAWSTAKLLRRSSDCDCRSQNDEKPVKHGVARGWRFACHPVPPCHPQRCA